MVNGIEGVGVSRPLRIEYPGAFYHVTSRGNERRTVFQSNRDREKYLSYLESAHERDTADKDVCGKELSRYVHLNPVLNVAA
jgi:hypothetical protein